jgi:CO/xanthine dehydrogenase Mo-binding subunit
MLKTVGHEIWSGNQPAMASAGPPPTEAVSMRAPGEAVGPLALECATDELAEQFGMDPVALRIRSDTQHDPETGPGRPFSSRHLVACRQKGARRFGWKKRSARLDGQGFLTVSTAMTDISPAATRS